MLSRQNSSHNSTISASDTSTIEDDGDQGVGRLLFSALRLVGSVVERQVASYNLDSTSSASSTTLASSSEWEDRSESSTISHDIDQGLGRIAWQFMRFAGEQVEQLTLLNSDQVGKQARARSRAIDRQIKRGDFQMKFLLAGTSGAGKSTLINHMKLHNGLCTITERESYKPIVVSASIRAMAAMIATVRGMGLQLSPKNDGYADILLSSWDLNVAAYPSSEILGALTSIYQDKSMKHVLAQPPKYEPDDFTLHFVRAVERITAADYIPTDEDILYSRQKATGVTETEIVAREYKTSWLFPKPAWTFQEPCCHNLPRNWIGYFQEVEGIVFVVSLSDYDQYQDGKNQLEASLDLFSSIRFSPFITSECRILLVLNKLDCFRDKLIHIPLQSHLPGYTGGNNADEASTYVRKLFLRRNRPTCHMYVFITTLSETSSKTYDTIAGACWEMMAKRAMDPVGL